jgi:hypothetical protein
MPKFIRTNVFSRWQGARGVANRRQFLTASIVTSALATSLPVEAATLFAGSQRITLADFVYDDRYVPGAQMAQKMDHCSTRTHATSGDVAELWYDDLVPALINGPRTIGGLTPLGGLFVMARLGQDAGLTLAMRGTHQLTRDGRTFAHALTAPEDNQLRFNAALNDGASWTSALQMELLALASRSATDRFELPDMKSHDLAGQTTLHSWLLTPRP